MKEEREVIASVGHANDISVGVALAVVRHDWLIVSNEKKTRICSGDS